MSTVEQISLDRWGVRPAAAEARFAEPGWSYEEQVARPCPRCTGVLYSLRKPYVRAGRTQRYVALVCPACPASFTLANVGLTTYDQVRRAAATPSREPRRATARPAGGEATRRERILRFWRSVELFGCRTLERPDPAEDRYRVPANGVLPWQKGHPVSRRPLEEHLRRRHTVYGGVYRLDRLHERLEAAFGPSGPDVHERIPRGESALFAVLVTQDGRLLLDSLVLSTAAWAVGRAVQPGPDDPGWLDGFEAAADRITAAMRTAVAAAHDDALAAALSKDGVTVSRPVAHRELTELVELVARELSVADVLAPAGLQVHTEKVASKRVHETQLDFLNSFVMDDLERVADAVADGDCGPALAVYLSADDAVARIHRVNLRDASAEDLLLDTLAPAGVPAGRWPARASHPLATSQQLAINAS